MFYIVLGEMTEENAVAEDRLRQLLDFPYDLTPPTSQPTAFNSLMQLGEASTSGLRDQLQEQPVQS
jgi:hypothetical protein